MKNPLTNGRIVGDKIPNSVYQRTAGQRGTREYVVSRSDLVAIWLCPREWRAGTGGDLDTPSTRHGTCLDTIISGQDDEMVVCPENYPDSKTGEPKKWTRAAKYCKEWEKLREGKLIVKKVEHDAALLAAERLLADEILGEYVRCSRKQVMVLSEYHDQATGITVPVRTLIDLLPDPAHVEHGKTVGDLKTGRSIAPGPWKREVFSRGYHIQAALYIDSLTAAGEDRVDDFRHIISKNQPPYEPGRRHIGAEFIELGRGAYLSALKLYCQCLSTDWWPGYDDFQTSDTIIPGWTTCSPEPWMLQAWETRQVAEVQKEPEAEDETDIVP